MKSIILAGASRSGKTTLTKRLQKTGEYTSIFSDRLIHAFVDHFPELGILRGQREATSANLLPFLKTYIDSHADFQGSPFVLDTGHLFPQQVVDHELDKKYITLFIGYPNISPEEKFRNIRSYPNKPFDWTQSRSDEEIMKTAHGLVNFSKFLEMECQKHNLTFVDTSYNFIETLDQTYQSIIGAN